MVRFFVEVVESFVVVFCDIWIIELEEVYFLSIVFREFLLGFV